MVAGKEEGIEQGSDTHTLGSGWFVCSHMFRAEGKHPMIS